ncbi:unnamed protein product [Blepharisma stoltei]|uniref:Myb-like DNA-binding domain containing protein n=1 Tax=Blepharisma stoltei TaxID=1481888 RepID=A0AAU9IED0_9CILI|nr:unnamed protein product [Blepharisma stoltei]
MSNSSRKPWNQDEDDAIRSLVEEHGIKQWSLIASLLVDRYGIKGRTGKQCRERWHNHLDPNVKKDHWTFDEEKIIFDYQRANGNKWSELTNLLPGRSDNAIKNHFYSTIRKNLRRFNKRKPSSERINLTTKDVIQSPEHLNILINFHLETNTRNCSFENKELRRSNRLNLKRDIELITTNLKENDINYEASSILYSLFEDNKKASKPHIICPSVPKDIFDPLNFLTNISVKSK